MIPESIGVFVGLSLVLFGGAAFMIGPGHRRDMAAVVAMRALRPVAGRGCRFLTYALFGAYILSVGGYLAAAS